mmetsp:Transcript_5015/g.12784  ORF Transcript_5015/g.12784 Transcript_5015/m.12784 type:complete len:214 (+) Transcript_5015:653-1294(+)
MPHDQIACLGAKLKQLRVIKQAIFLQVDEDRIIRDLRVLVRALEVDWSSMVWGSVVHCHPPAQRRQLFVRAALRCAEGVDRAVLVVLVPLESFVGVHHQQIRGEAQFLGIGQPRKRTRQRRVVQEVGERIVGSPDGALNVVIQPRSHARDRPEVGVFNLPVCGTPQILQPLGREKARDVHRAVLQKSAALLLGDLEGHGRCALDHAGWELHRR